MEHRYPFHIHAPGRESAAPPLCGRDDVPLSAIVDPLYTHAVDCPACCVVLGVDPPPPLMMVTDLGQIADALRPPGFELVDVDMAPPPETANTRTLTLHISPFLPPGFVP